MKRVLLSLFFDRAISIEGGGTQLRALASALEGAGHAPTLHAHFGDGPTLPWDVVDYHRPRRLGYRAYLQHLRSLVSDYDSVWVFDNNPAIGLTGAGAFPDSPHVLRCYGSPLQDLAEILRPPFSLQYAKHWLAKNAWLARLVPQAAGPCVVGTVHQQRQLERLGVPRERIHVVPIGLPRAEASGLPTPTEARARYGLPDGPLVAYLGHFSPIKGVPVLVEAFARLLRRVPDAHLVLAWSGKGDEAQRVQRALAAPALREHVTLLRIVEPVAFLRAADVAALPYVHGSLPHFPQVLTEAFAAGTPVVVGDVAGLHEMVRDGETGRLVPPGDPEALADTLESLLLDPALREALGRNQLESFLSHYTAEQAVARMLDIA